VALDLDGLGDSPAASRRRAITVESHAMAALQPYWHQRIRPHRRQRASIQDDEILVGRHSRLLAHHAAAALGKRNEVLAPMGEVLLHCEATNSGPLSAVAIPKLGIRSITPEEFVLDGDHEIANPAG
jgi:hypothetical protein